MIKWILQKIVGSKNLREIRRIRPVVARINEIEEALQREPEEKLRELTQKWRDHLARYHDLKAPAKPILYRMEEQELNDAARDIAVRFSRMRDEFPELPASIEPTPESIEAAKEAFRAIEPSFRERRAKYLEQILPDAYAVVKNGARRMCGRQITVCDHSLTWEMVHFDVQLIGGIALHRGMIAEMQTGEGKTLVATLPVYLNALTGLGVHVVTVNDYLARRDSQWMGSLYQCLGLSVGCIQNQMHPHDRREQYACDITYGTNSEFGFDYLRDNGLASKTDEQVKRGHYFAVIDEVDSILIDEARTPLIISGTATEERVYFQYETFKPSVEQLIKQQTILCNQIASDVKNAYESGDKTAAGIALFKLKLGQPRNRLLLRYMEDPEMRRLMEKAELSFYQDAQKTELFKLKEELFFVIDEKGNDADLMERGREFLSPNSPEDFILPDLGTLQADIQCDKSLTQEEKNVAWDEIKETSYITAARLHAISQLLKAYCLFDKDVRYVVKNNKIIIIDENTGREMPGRNWSDGLHQAIEAKENIPIVNRTVETKVMATITFQNYFRHYEKLAGMTGTAETEAAEFHDIYKLDVLPIPPNRPNLRIDENDQVFKTRREKFNAVVKKVTEAHEKGQPVLIGTASVEASETLSRLLKRAKIQHSVLNAKYHEQEADIIANAGQRGAVTVSTNMAGRGTDIKLGAGVADLGGLFVISTERHESRRIDRQLRGRCARQGDPGRSQAFLSFEDDLMRNFAAAERMTQMMERFGMEDGEALEHSWLNRSVETAQKRVEQRNYIWRKRVLDFDDVMNKQREVVYGYRNEILITETPHDLVTEIIEKVIAANVINYFAEHDANTSDLVLLTWIHGHYPIQVNFDDVQSTKTPEQLTEMLIQRVKEAYESRTSNLLPEILEEEERRMLLAAIDQEWQKHLTELEGLRESIGLRAQGQKDPLVEYKNEAYNLFVELMGNIEQEAFHNLFRSAAAIEAFLKQLQNAPRQMQASDEIGHDNIARSGPVSAQLLPSPEGTQIKLNLPKRRPSFDIATSGRNAPCPCGSGKKFKQCCGQEPEAEA